MKVAVVITHPAPYREAVLKRLKADSRLEVDIVSIFSSDFGHPDMELGDDRGAIAAEVKTLYPGFFSGIKIAWRLLRRFWGRRYDFVIWPAYAPWWLTIPVAIRAFLGRRYAIALDTVRESCRCFSRAIKRWLFEKAEFLWVPGLASRKYLVSSYGVTGTKIVSGLYIPEFVTELKLREKGDVPTFLMVANNTPFRRMEAVANGYNVFVSGGGKGRLILCGKGASAFSGNSIETIDGVPSTALPELYARSDVYVHNGNEQFSAALLMGAMAGLPLFVGAEVGAAADLMREDNSTGLKVEDWQNPNAWAEAFSKMTSLASSWPSMSSASLRQASAFNPEDVASEIAAKVLAIS